jgi:hypothetical protein
MNIEIKVMPNSYETDEDGFYYCLNEIRINDFYETNIMALDYWSEADYQRQWKEGLARIKLQDTSCLVASVQHPIKSGPLLNWWILFKENDRIIVNNLYTAGKRYIQVIGDKNFSPDNCYDFIRPRDTSKTIKGYQVSEWFVEL